MDVSLIVLNYNDYITTEKLVNSVKNYSAVDHVVVIDNNSSDDSYCRLSKLSDEKVSVVRTDKNGGYGYGNNFGIEYAENRYDSDYYVICNPDIEFEEKTLASILNVMSKDNGIVCASTIPYTPKGNVQSKFCWNIPTPLSAVLSSGKILQKFFRFDWLSDNCCDNKDFIEVDCVPGSFLVLGKKLIKAGKVYDEKVFLYYEETILGYRIKRLGYKTVMVNGKYIHHHSVSIDKNISSTVKQRRIMYESLLYFIRTYLKPPKLILAFCNVYLKIIIYENYLDGMIAWIKGVRR